MRLMLDAHTVLWALYEPEQLPPLVARLLADETNLLFVSDASIWGFLSKAAAYRLPLMGASPEPFFARLSELDVTLLPITMREIVASALLPSHHRDPFDRMLVAQAQANDLTLLTTDDKMPLYEVEALWR